MSQRSLDCQVTGHADIPGVDTFEGKCSDRGWSKFPSSKLERLPEYPCQLHLSQFSDYVTG